MHLVVSSSSKTLSLTTLGWESVLNVLCAERGALDVVELSDIGEPPDEWYAGASWRKVPFLCLRSSDDTLLVWALEGGR